MKKIRVTPLAFSQSQKNLKSIMIGVSYGSYFLLNSAIAGTTITAPLFPLMQSGLTEHSGTNYPETSSEQLTIAKLYHLSFNTIKEKCNTVGTDIAMDTSLSNEKIVANYQKVAKCSYTEFSAKPYYIPQLVNDVDMCQEILGSDYRMITEEDINGFSNAFYTELNTVFTSVDTEADSGFYTDFYFSRATYIRDNKGALKIGNLYPHVINDRITDVDGDWDLGDDEKRTADWKKLLLATTLDVGDIHGTFAPNMQDVKIGLRCILNK